MIKSIKIKLWLTLFVTLVFSLGLLLALSFLSVKRQFISYANEQILDRLAPLEKAVIDVYSQKQSLLDFIEKPKRWSQLRDSTYREYLSFQKQQLAYSSPKPVDWSERESIEDQLQPNQRAFFQHLVLYDATRKLVSGSEKNGANYIKRPVVFNDVIIAHIGYIKPTAFLRSVDKLFFEQQSKTFAALTAFMIFVAFVVTLMLSRWLVKPLILLTQSTDKVAAGDFSARVNYTSNDELGTLCHNFDKMARSLEKNEDHRKQWVADISHEMRTPISVLKAQIEAMEDGIRPINQENLQLLKNKIDSLAHVVADLYEISLTDLGALRLQKENTDLKSLVEESLANFEEKLDEKDLNCRLVADDKSYTLNADKNRLFQVLNNLLENAYRYTDPGGEIRITIKSNNLDKDKRAFNIDIEDSPPGVENIQLDKIYDRLYRVEASRNRALGGAGLGLSICKGIIEMHHGTITASHSELGGLRQTICLPYEP